MTWHHAYFAIEPNVEKEAVHVGTNKVCTNEMWQTKTIELTPRQKLVVVVHYKHIV